MQNASELRLRNVSLAKMADDEQMQDGEQVEPRVVGSTEEKLSYSAEEGEIVDQEETST